MDNERDCVMCDERLLLCRGTEWPKAAEDTLCWSCQDAEIERLREALALYADMTRWGFRYQSPLQRLWRGVDDEDVTAGWHVAKEALISPWKMPS